MNLENKILDAHQKARTHIQGKHQHQKTQYDRKALTSKYQEGELIWLNNPSKKMGRSPKLQTFWEKEPWKVIQILSEVVLRIQKLHKRKQRVVHVDRVQKVRRPEEWDVLDLEEVEAGREEPITPLSFLQTTGINPVRRGRSQQPSFQQVQETVNTVRRTSWTVYVKPDVRRKYKRTDNRIVYHNNHGSHRDLPSGGERSLHQSAGGENQKTGRKTSATKPTRTDPHRENRDPGLPASGAESATSGSRQHAPGADPQLPKPGRTCVAERGTTGCTRGLFGVHPAGPGGRHRPRPGPDYRELGPRDPEEWRRRGQGVKKEEGRTTAEWEEHMNIQKPTKNFGEKIKAWRKQEIKSASLLYQEYMDKFNRKL